MRIRYSKTIILLLLVACGVIYYGVWLKELPEAQVAFLDIGQGDATLVTLPSERVILIDGGPSVRILDSLDAHLPFFTRSIDLIVLSHPHADHLRGFMHVLRHYDVERALIAGVVFESDLYREFLELLRDKEVAVYAASAGDRLLWGGQPTLEVLAPSAVLTGAFFHDVHESMVVVRLSVGDESFLVMGDAEIPLERELVASGLIEPVGVLRVGHHGSRTSTGEELLHAARPHAAVISLGEGNRYGHPHPEVLQRLDAFGIPVLRTDLQGDIVWSFRVW